MYLNRFKEEDLILGRDTFFVEQMEKVIREDFFAKQIEEIVREIR